MNAKQLRDVAERLFQKKLTLNSLHQEIADNFYPERADFTIQRSLGMDFAANLMTSYPVLCRRDLGNQFGTMLRPTARPWFHLSRRYTDEEDNETKRWLKYFEDTERKIMYDPRSRFTKATKEGDHDFAAFGQCVISVEMNKSYDGFLYRCWHLRDCAWQEDEEGKIGFISRNWKPTAADLVNLFPKTVDPKTARTAEKDPFTEQDCLHIVCKAEMYDDDAGGHPRWSIFYDKMNDKVLEATPIWGKYYILPRWQTVSNSFFGSQYSFSPAVVAALPDARLLQAMAYTLLEAGEKATSPPMIATAEAFRSDLGLYAGGISWADVEAVEQAGGLENVLRPLNQDFRGFNFGVQMNQDTRQMLREAFYLNVLQMPERGPEMTAYEVGQRVQEYIRNALPIFEPLEMEYNAAICEETFDLAWRNGAFGSPTTWPKSLQGIATGNVEVEFGFESPLHDAIAQMDGQIFVEGKGLIAEAIAMDPSASAMIATLPALRDALMGIGWKATWLNSEEVVAAAKKQAQVAAQAQTMLASMEQASNVSKNLGAAQQATAASQSGYEGVRPVPAAASPVV